jgi:glutamate formiminotransferase
MADEIPADLIDAQRAYYEADRRVQEVTDALPSPQEVLEGAQTEEQGEELAQVREERLTALEALNRHPWWEQDEQKRDRHAAWMALQKAAKD